MELDQRTDECWKNMVKESEKRLCITIQVVTVLWKFLSNKSSTPWRRVIHDSLGDPCPFRTLGTTNALVWGVPSVRRSCRQCQTCVPSKMKWLDNTAWRCGGYYHKISSRQELWKLPVSRHWNYELRFVWTMDDPLGEVYSPVVKKMYSSKYLLYDEASAVVGMSRRKQWCY